MIERILGQWSMLRKVISTAVFTNVFGAKPVMKVIRAIYVEFNTKTNNQSQLEGVTPTYVFLDEYDRVFQFEKTTYRIHKYTLIVTLNIRLTNGVTSSPLNVS